MSNEMLLTAAAWTVVQVIRAMPAVIWSLRCRPGSRAYRCPPVYPSLRAQTAKPSSGAADV